MPDQMKPPVQLEGLFRSAVHLCAHTTCYRDSLKARFSRVVEERERSTADLQSICDCLAIEQGYDNWNAMCRWVAELPAKPEDAELTLVNRRLAGISDEAYTHGSGQPTELGTSLGVRLVTLDQSVSIPEIVAAGVNEPIAPLFVPPLAYVCCSKYGAKIPSLRQLRRQWVNRLVEGGADVNAGMRERESIRGYRTCLGGSIGCARDHEIAQRLLAAGADIADGPTLYEGSAMWEAVQLRDHAALDVLLAAKPPEWHLCHALTHCLQFHDLPMVVKLLEHGADPNWDKTVFGMSGNALHEAIHCDCLVYTLATLIDHGASLSATDEGGRTPLTIAVALGRADLTDLLVVRGANLDEVGDFERFVGACFRADEHLAAQLRSLCAPKHTPSYHDHLWVHAAIKRVAHHTLELLMTWPFDLEAIDYQGDTALHRAVRLHDEHVAKCLIEHSASTAVQNFDGDNVIDLALRLSGTRDTRIVEVLAKSLSQEQFNQRGTRLRPADIEAFEDAVDSIASGDAETLRSLLAQHPYFINARSARPHHCELTNYIGVNGFESERQKSPANAVEIIEILLERGCDPNVLCYTYRGGPGQTTLGLLLSSDVVASAQQQTAMVRALVKGGAVIDASYQLFFKLLDAQDANETESVLKSIDINDDDTRRAYFTLSNNHEYGLVQALLDAGMDIDRTNELGQSALHWAALNGDEERVDWLIARGADPTLRERQFGGAPAGWADAGGHVELARRLARIQRDAS